MPGAMILADQLTGAGAGSAGQARNDLWLGQVIQLTSTLSGNSSQLWELLATPPGSSVVLGTPTSVTSSWTPDVIGTYRIRLTTNGGGVGNVQTRVYRVRYSSIGVLQNRGWAYPAFSEVDLEANYGGNLRGWAEDLEFILEDIRTTLSDPLVEGYGIDLVGTTVSQKSAVTVLTGSGAIAIDAAVGPQYKTTLTGNSTLSNPSNATEGRHIILAITQDATGSHTLGFSSNWIAVDPTTSVDLTPFASSLIIAHSRNTGSGVKWLYTLTHASETSTPFPGYGIAVSGSTVSQKTALTTLTDAGTVAIDASLGPEFKVTIGGNRTLANPSNTIEGQRIFLSVTQDGTGSRTLGFGSNWVSIDPTTSLNTVAGSTSLVTAIARDVGAGVKWFYTVSHANDSTVISLQSAYNSGTSITTSGAASPVTISNAAAGANLLAVTDAGGTTDYDADRISPRQNYTIQNPDVPVASAVGTSLSVGGSKGGPAVDPATPPGVGGPGFLLGGDGGTGTALQVSGAGADVTLRPGAPGASGGAGVGASGNVEIVVNSTVSPPTTPQLRFKELPANGSNYVALRAPNSLSANTVFVLPSTDGTVGQSLKTDGSANLSWQSGNFSLVLDLAATPGYNVYNTLATVLAAANALSGIVQITILTSLSVSTGTYNFSNTVLRAGVTGTLDDALTITFLGTSGITGLPLELDHIQLINQKNIGTWLTLSGSPPPLVIRSNGGLVNTSTSQHAVNVNTHVVDIYTNDDSVLTGNGATSQLFTTTSTGTVNLYTTGPSFRVTDAFVFGGNLAVNVFYGGGNILDHRSTNPFTSLTGTFTVSSYEQKIPFIFTPTTISSSQNNYNPTGLAWADKLRLSSSSSVNITGLDATSWVTNKVARELVLTNIGSNLITLVHQSGSSTHKFFFVGLLNLVLGPGSSVSLYFDPTSSFWRPAGSVVNYPVVTTLTDAVTISIDASTGPQYEVTLAGNRTFGNPTNSIAGQRISIAVKQDGTGGRTLAFSSDWIATDSSVYLNPTASTVSLVVAEARSFGGAVKWYYSVETLTPVVVLTDAATINIDASQGPQYELTIGGNRTLANPSNPVAGQRISLAIKQDVTGGRTLAFGSNWVSIDSTTTLDPVAGIVTLLVAEARAFGGTVKWYYSMFSEFEAAGGEANDGANLGAGSQIFTSKSGVNLQFRSIVAGTGVSATQNTNDITIASTETASNLGAGSGAFSSKVGADYQFKSFVAGTNVTITPSSTTLTIAATGEANTASNSASGVGTGLVFKAKSGVDLIFKKFFQGYGVALTNGTDDITVASKTAVTTLTDAATIAIDADVGPNYQVTITANQTLGNPTNSAVGKKIRLAVKQDATGGWTLGFGSNWVATDGTTVVDPAINAVSFINAEARDFGGGVFWYYVVTSQLETGGTGESNTASNLGGGTGVFASKVSLDLQFKSLLSGYNTTLSNTSSTVTIADKTTVTTLTDAATIAVDAAVGPRYEVTLAATRVMGNPTNSLAGQFISIAVKQDATGGRDLTFSANWVAVDPSLVIDQTASAVSLVWAEARSFGGTVKWYYWITSATDVGTVGETNTASNLGAGSQVFKQKTGVDLEFRSLVSGANVTVTQNANDISIAATGEANTASNLGAGSQSFKSKVGVDLQFRSIVAGTAITVTQNANDISIATTAEANTASNLGSGSGVFASKSGIDLRFKSLGGGYGTTVSATGTDITVAKSTTVTTLTDAATIAVDANTGPNYQVTLGGSRTLGNPTNSVAGQTITILVAQDATGNRVLSFGANWIPVDPTVIVDPSANAVSLIEAIARDFGSGVKWYFFLTGVNEASTLGETNTASNLGAGAGVFSLKSGVDLQFKTLVAGTNVTITPSSTTLTIATSAAGETNTASNLGSGSQAFKAKVGVDLQFRSFVGGYGLSSTQNTDDVTYAVKSAVTTLTDAATIAVDASVGPQYQVTLGGSRTLGNPTNSAVGRTIEVLVSQDATGDRFLAFDTNWINEGSLRQVSQQASSVSVVYATARDFGSGVKWYYTIEHGELLTSSPAQVTANQTAWDPTGRAWARMIRATSDASRDIQGVLSPTFPQEQFELDVVNVGTNNLVLKHNDTGAAAANRLLLPGDADITFYPGDAITLRYDRVSTRWRTF